MKLKHKCSENDNASEDSHAGLSRLIESRNQWLTLQHRVAWMVQFCQWVADKRISSSTGPLTVEELQSTEVIFPWFKKSSKVGNLKPVLVDRVLWVGAQLQKAVILSWDKKQPMVKPLEQFMGSLP